MPDALVVSDLVTVDMVRLHCLRDENDASLDSLWSLLIPAVSEAVTLWADRQFTPEDDATHVFSGEGRVQFTPWELREVTSVSATDYALLPLGGTAQGTYWSMWSDADETVAVTGDWGMSAIPPSVQLAVLTAVDSYYRNPAMHQSESLGPYSFSDVASQPELGGLPRASRALLDPFRRLSVT